MAKNEREMEESKNLFAYTRYYQGSRAALKFVLDNIAPLVKGDDGVLIRSELRMAIQSLRNVERFMQGDEVRFRAHKKKGGKLIGVEAYFLTNKTH